MWHEKVDPPWQVHDTTWHNWQILACNSWAIHNTYNTTQVQLCVCPHAAESHDYSLSVVGTKVTPISDCVWMLGAATKSWIISGCASWWSHILSMLRQCSPTSSSHYGDSWCCVHRHLGLKLLICIDYEHSKARCIAQMSSSLKRLEACETCYTFLRYNLAVRMQTMMHKCETPLWHWCHM